ncbi:DUF3558 domain-containing protein [Amycolatopsis pigmentata]|uniref:DUF3558 domain-containing protein n=1 Tax=Amycolatopsis pigmentata TaxID=450801 RepID=A0ABW5FQY6_9PSEU
MRGKLLVSVGLIGFVLLQGCSSTPGAGTPSGTVSSTNSSSSVSAPKVQNPLPASVISKHPCLSALTDGQLADLIGEVPQAQHTDNAAGPGCGWTKPSTAAGIDVAWMTGLRNGLSDYYAQKQRDAYQQPITIGGYPAVAYNSTEVHPVGDCSVGVGIADNLAFDVHFIVGSDRYGKLNPCDAAKAIAEDVLTNLKAAQ